MTDEIKYSDLERKLRQECERGRKVGPRTPSAVESPRYGPAPVAWLSPTGEPFIEIGLMDMPARKPLGSAQECYDAALAAFRKYAANRPGTLYWRTYPEIERGRFYMRLMISDKPPLAPHKEMT